MIPPAEKLKPEHEPMQGEIASLSWLDDVDTLAAWLAWLPDAEVLVAHMLVSSALPNEVTLNLAVMGERDHINMKVPCPGLRSGAIEREAWRGRTGVGSAVGAEVAGVALALAGLGVATAVARARLGARERGCLRGKQLTSMQVRQSNHCNQPLIDWRDTYKSTWRQRGRKWSSRAASRAEVQWSSSGSSAQCTWCLCHQPRGTVRSLIVVCCIQPSAPQ